MTGTNSYLQMLDISCVTGTNSYLQMLDISCVTGVPRNDGAGVVTAPFDSIWLYMYDYFKVFNLLK